jgi:hypothetical protein
MRERVASQAIGLRVLPEVTTCVPVHRQDLAGSVLQSDSSCNVARPCV